MKKFSSKILGCLIIALCLLSTFSMYMPVQAAGIAPYTYSVNTFSFTGSCGISRGCTGYYLDITVKSTASNNNNETITLEVYIVNRNVTKTYTYYSDGRSHSFNNIWLGWSGGSSVYLTFTGANPSITITTELTLES